MSSFTLSKTSTWYAFVLAINGSWGANLPGTVYVDNWQIANIHYLLGDFNGDYQITNSDLQALLVALKNPTAYELSSGLTATAFESIADVNGDGTFNAADIQAEMNLLTAANAGSGSTSAVPEPASLLLLALAGLNFIAVKHLFTTS